MSFFYDVASRGSILEESPRGKVDDNDIFLAMSGNAPSYTPDVWNDFQEAIVVTIGRHPSPSLQLNSNCYSYALNQTHHCRYGGMNPRDALTGSALSAESRKVVQQAMGDVPETFSDFSRTYTQEIFAGMVASSLKYIGKKPAYVGGHYLVAFFICPAGPKTAMDYHFVRQNANSSAWSHKIGLHKINNTDESGNIIIDPRAANMGNYRFITFMAVPRRGIQFAPEARETFRDGAVAAGRKALRRYEPL